MAKDEKRLKDHGSAAHGRILDVGCGNNKYPGSIGIDLDLHSAADTIVNLNRFPYPFRDNSFSRIVSKQVFEHIEDVEKVMRELSRIAVQGATIIIEVPHFSCYLAYGDPTHKRSFSVFSFDTIVSRCGMKIVKRQIGFHKSFRKYRINRLFNRFPRGYERFWAFMIPAEHLHFEMKVMK
jgi:SAM-dependent methyltransferase